MSTDTPAPPSATSYDIVFGAFEAKTEIEAHIMMETASILHRRLVDELDALPWWRRGLIRGLSRALVTTGGACFEFADDAERLAEAGPS